MAQTALVGTPQGLCRTSGPVLRADLRSNSTFLGSNAAFMARAAPKPFRRERRFAVSAVAEPTAAAAAPAIKAEDVQGAIDTVRVAVLCSVSVVVLAEICGCRCPHCVLRTAETDFRYFTMLKKGLCPCN